MNRSSTAIAFNTVATLLLVGCVQAGQPVSQGAGGSSVGQPVVAANETSSTSGTDTSSGTAR